MHRRPANASPGHAALRKGRYSQAQQIYLITFTTYQRKPLFSDFELACLAARHLCDDGNWNDARLLAWVLMPDHWHGLLALGPGASLSYTIQGLKTNSARKLRLAHPDIGRIWARAFHDRALRHDESVLAAARYLVMNPVRAGITRRIGVYPFWDAVWL